MANRIALNELASLLAKQSKSSKAVADEFCRQYFAVIKEYLFRDGIVKIKGFGTFKLLAVNGRESIDVSSGRRIEISAHSRITFTPDKLLATRINKPFETFEIVLVEGEEEDMETQPQEPVKEKLTPKSEVEYSEVHSVYLGNDTENTPQPVAEKNTEPLSVPEELTPHPVDNTLAEATGNTPQEEIQQPETPQYEYDFEEESHGKVWVWITSILLGCVLLVMAYFTGYYQLLGETDVLKLLNTPADTTLAKPAETKVDTACIKTDSIVAKQQQDSLQSEVSDALSEEDKANADQYEQLPGGEYLIVGTLEEHEIRVGDNLLMLAKKKYGDHKCAQYIILYNKISNPDIIPLGYKLKLPRLVKR